jgi:FecR-like protein
MLKTTIQKKYLFMALALLALFSSTSFAADLKESAIIENIKGEAWASHPDLPKRALSEKSVVYENDEIKTGKDSSLTILFKDKTKFDIGSESSLLISKFIYKNSENEDGITVKVLKGTFRFLSGFIAKKKPKAMAVGTSVATIGIRGTHVAGEVEPTSARIVLMEKEDPTAANKIEVFNEFGSVTIDEAGYGTEIPDEFSPPSPVRRMRLQSINNLTRSIQRVNTPRPRPRF